MNQLTNQELVNELQKRVQDGTLETLVMPKKWEKETKSLFSYLDSKDLLLLISLTVGFTFLVCHILQITTSSVSDCSIGFQNGESKIT